MLNKLLVAIAAAGFAATALAAEYPIGKPKEINGLEVAAVYLQPVEMEPKGMMRATKESDIHLEADIHATADNKNGRVVIAQKARGTGLGRLLMAEGLRHGDEAHPGQPNRISAQAHLAKFYAEFGYAPVGEPYEEDKIPHLEMLRRP